MSTELVPADNMAAVEAMPPEAQALAITQMLSEARGWLAHAVEASEPQSIANFKAQMATVAEATKQLGLSKEIQLDAQEMVRRAERGVGLAVRKGEEEGTIETWRESRQRAAQTAHGLHHDENLVQKTRRAEVVSPDDWTGNRAGIADLTDGVTDEQFDQAITEAKSEENLGRANVVRKIRGEPSALSGEKRLDRIRELASQGWVSGQIGREIGHSETYVRRLANAAGIVIPADQTLRGMHRGIDHTQIVANTVSALDALASGIQIIRFDEVDLAQAEHWLASLSHSLRALNRFHKQIREASHDQQQD